MSPRTPRSSIAVSWNPAIKPYCPSGTPHSDLVVSPEPPHSGPAVPPDPSHRPVSQKTSFWPSSPHNPLFRLAFPWNSHSGPAGNWKQKNSGIPIPLEPSFRPGCTPKPIPWNPHFCASESSFRSHCPPRTFNEAWLYTGTLIQTWLEPRNYKLELSFRPGYPPQSGPEWSFSPLFVPPRNP